MNKVITDIEISKRTLITIGILCFNAEKTILDAIRSAVNQSWENKEIILVDDASSDNSVEKIRNSQYFKNLKLVVNTRNKGASFSRNKIVIESRGEFICFFDDDDISDLMRVEKQLASIKEKGLNANDKVVSICKIKRIYPTGYKKEMKALGYLEEKRNLNHLADFLLMNNKLRNINYGFGCPTCAMLISKICFEKLGYFDENLRRVEDMELSIRLSLKGCNFLGTNDTFIEQFSTNTSDKNPKVNFESEKLIIEKYKYYLDKNDLFNFSLLWTNLRYFYFSRNLLKLIITLIKLFIIKPIRLITHFSRSAFLRLIHEIKIIKGGN